MLAALAALAVIQTAAPPPAPRTWTTAQIQWVRRPVPDFPTLAQSRGVREGMALLDCEVGAAGSFSNCMTVSESPAGVEFGAKAVASMYRARIAVGPGSPAVGDVVRGVVIRFNVGP